MKHCPQCKNTYTDESISFCLVDGTRLLKNDPLAETVTEKISPPTVYEYRAKKIVEVGSYANINFRNRNIRIVVKEIKAGTIPIIPGYLDNIKKGAERKESAVILYVDTGGGLVYGGARTEEIGVNEFLLPVHKYDEELSSIFAFNFKDGRVSFFRVYAEHINPNGNIVDLNIQMLAN